MIGWKAEKFLIIQWVTSKLDKQCQHQADQFVQKNSWKNENLKVLVYCNYIRNQKLTKIDEWLNSLRVRYLYLFVFYVKHGWGIIMVKKSETSSNSLSTNSELSRELFIFLDQVWYIRIICCWRVSFFLWLKGRKEQRFFKVLRSQTIFCVGELYFRFVYCVLYIVFRFQEFIIDIRGLVKIFEKIITKCFQYVRNLNTSNCFGKKYLLVNVF